MFTKTLFPSHINHAATILKTLPLNISSLKLAPLVDIVRYGSRKGTRAAADAAKRARKLQQANKPEEIPKYLQRKEKVSAEFERRRCTDENWLESQPIDNVYNMKLYRGKPFLVSEAVAMHRETHEPEMLNDPNALIFANVELDLKLKKKNKFLDDINGIMQYPCEFNISKKNKVVVVCKQSSDQSKASDAGAVYTGSTALVKQIISGAVSKEDFDYLVCHPDSYKEVASLRGILGKKYPNANNGLLRLDVDVAVKTFINGIEYNLKHSNIEQDFGWIDVSFGRLDMPIEDLEKNLEYCLNMIEKNKPVGTDNNLFIIRTLLFCEKSRERFKIPHWNYVRNYPENGILVQEEAEERAA